VIKAAGIYPAAQAGWSNKDKLPSAHEIVYNQGHTHGHKGKDRPSGSVSECVVSKLLIMR
jgi:hypothetical protein